jgi:hypothetical protein
MRINPGYVLPSLDKNTPSRVAIPLAANDFALQRRFYNDLRKARLK